MTIVVALFNKNITILLLYYFYNIDLTNIINSTDNQINQQTKLTTKLAS